MGIANDMQRFCTNICVSVEKINTISYRRGRICTQLNTDFWGFTYSDIYTHSFYGGSYGRGTAIDSTSDVDLLFIMPTSVYDRYNSYTGNKQSSFLQAVRSSIMKTYPSTDIGADGQVIVVTFGDGIKFEVVPVFELNDGTYRFADTNDGGKWKTTNPKPEIKAIADLDKTCNGNLKNLCRMARAWKNKWSVEIGGLLIDTLAHNFLCDYGYRDKTYVYYDWISRDFFKYLSEQKKDQWYWLAPGSNQFVWRSGAFVDKASSCHTLAVEAIEKEKSPSVARESWRKIYGTVYPNAD